MFLKRLFLVVLSVFVLQSFPVSVYAKESRTAPNAIVYSRLQKENLVPAKVLSDLSVKKVKKGDILKFELVGNVESGDKTLVSSGSILEGKVVAYRKALLFRSDAYVDVLINAIQTGSEIKNIENQNVKLRIADYHYKGFWRRTFQRTPVVLCGVATSIALSQATNMNCFAYGSIAFGVGTAVGFISGLIDPDIDKTRRDGAILRAIEGSPYGTVVITVQRGYNLNLLANSIVLIKFDEETKQKLLGV